MNTILQAIRKYLKSYCHFSNPDITLVLSYWIAATYVFEAFDSFPYLVITARVKRAGKTRLSELIGFTSNMPFAVSGASAPALFRKIQDDKPTIIWDEAETLSSEANSLIRAFLNVGYRKGQTIPRATGLGVVEWPTYCPKVFVLIGDVYDTLRDRSIICEMERGEPGKRFSYETAKAEGLELADTVRAALAANLEKILAAYSEMELPFLTDRDEEIWRPLFALCKVMEPDLFIQLQTVAADLAAEKTNPYRFQPDVKAEQQTVNEEYARLLVRDMYIITHKIKGSGRNGKRAISTVDALAALKAIPTSPWRKFYSTSSSRAEGNEKTEPGLSANQLGDLLGTFGIHPTLHRVGEKVFRGYDAKKIDEVSKKLNLIPKGAL
jgi:hypothetical protein